MRKFLSIILIVTTIGCLGGCGKSEPTNEITTSSTENTTEKIEKIDTSVNWYDNVQPLTNIALVEEDKKEWKRAKYAYNGWTDSYEIAAIKEITEENYPIVATDDFKTEKIIDSTLTHTTRAVKAAVNGNDDGYSNDFNMPTEAGKLLGEGAHTVYVQVLRSVFQEDESHIVNFVGVIYNKDGQTYEKVVDVSLVVNDYNAKVLEVEIPNIEMLNNFTDMTKQKISFEPMTITNR